MRGVFIVGVLILFTFSVSAFEGDSFCLEFSEDDDLYEEYFGKCSLYYGENIYFSGLNMGIEYINEKSVRFIANGDSSNLLFLDDVFVENLREDKEIILEVYEIWDSKNNSGISFYYNFAEKEYDSFCYNETCVLNVDDSVFLGGDEISFLDFEDVGKGCFDLEFEFNRDIFDYEDVCVNDSVEVGEFELVFKNIDDDGVILFSHDFDWMNSSCEDSDGINFYSKGNVLGFYEDENYTYGIGEVEPYYFEDYCYFLEPVLVEFYCENGYVESMIVECDKCKNGECVNFTESEITEMKRLENLGKANFSSVEVCSEGCLFEGGCYSDGYNLSDRYCSETGWVLVENEKVEKSFFGKLWEWLFG